MFPAAETPRIPTKPKQVLVTGAMGMIARGILPILAGEFLLRLTDKPDSAAAGGAEVVPADLLEYEQIPPLMEGIDAVVHLAVASDQEARAPAADRMAEYDERMLDVNIKATAHILEAARRTGVKKVVYMSSLTVYFGDKTLSHYSESDINPQNLYACTKLFGENVGRVYARLHGMSVICLRIGQPYPSETCLDQVWQTNRNARSTYVAIEDVGYAVRQALKTSRSFGIYSIVSASDHPRFDISAAREIGYVPTAHFSASGIHRAGEGCLPGISSLSGQ